MKTVAIYSIGILLLACASLAMGATVYVDDDAAGANDGSDWGNAYNSLQDALAAAGSGDDIWVAQGTYKPDQGTGIVAGDRTATFQLKTGVALCGGFPSGGAWDDRDPSAYKTILSGDLDGDDVGDLSDPSRIENSYHVVTGGGTDETAGLDGFTITGGVSRIWQQGDPDDYSNIGAGMLNVSASPTVIDCIFTANLADHGAGMYNHTDSNPNLTNCTFENNQARVHGAAMANYNSSPTLTDCTFAGNTAGQNGGGIYNSQSNPTILDCVFYENQTGKGQTGSYPAGLGGNAGDGAGMYNLGASPELINCAFIENSTGNGGTGGKGQNPGVFDGGGDGGTGGEGGDGGGMYNSSSSPVLRNCTFSMNTTGSGGEGGEGGGSGFDKGDDGSGGSGGEGGGMYNDYSSPIIIDCSFTGNATGYGEARNCGGNGGGIYNYMCYSLEIQRSDLTANSTGDGSGMGSGGDGAGIFNQESHPTIEECSFVSNRTGDGGNKTKGDTSNPGRGGNGAGMYNCVKSSPSLIDCLFTENRTGNGGRYIEVTGFDPEPAGNAGDGAGMYNDDSTPDVTNCCFTANSTGCGGSGGTAFDWNPFPLPFDGAAGGCGGDGGGMFNTNSACPTITNCIFSANGTGDGGRGGKGSDTWLAEGGDGGDGGRGGYGAAVMNTALYDVTFRNCAFSGNMTGSGGDAGAGGDGWWDGDNGDKGRPGRGIMMNSDANPKLTNCTFCNNSSEAHVSIWNTGGSIMTVTNCILWDDTPYQIHLQESPLTTVTYSIVRGGGDEDWCGDGCIDLDPCFADAEGRLSCNSPCVDLGDNAAVPDDITLDLDGFPRIVDGDCYGGASVDMGAYEFQYSVYNVTQDIRYCSVQSAIEDAHDKDQIVVAPGRHNESINFLGKEIHLYSSAGPEATIIDGSGIVDAHHVVQCVSGEDANTVLEGFTITGGDARPGSEYACEQGGGMLVLGASTTPTVINCIFEGNHAVHGAGLASRYGKPILRDCIFRDNAAEQMGGAVFSYSGGGELTACRFSANHASYGGAIAGIHGYSPMISNCLFSGNGTYLGSSGGGGAIYVQSYTMPVIVNSTFSNNKAWSVGNALWCPDEPQGHSTIAIINSIMQSGSWPVDMSYLNVVVNDEAEITAVYSNINGGAGKQWFGTGCIDSAPRFVDAAGGDLRLAADSPCIDAGTNEAVAAQVTTDLDGNPRIVGDSVDMGAYEWAPGIIRVPTDHDTIRAAINAAKDGYLIAVAPGRYNEAIDFQGKAIRLYSTDGPEDTIIDGTGNYHVVQCVTGEGTGTILEGFTITGGSALADGGSGVSGGGMYIRSSSPTVIDCIFTGNEAHYGGGMHNYQATPTVLNCVFSDNTSDRYGGGMYNYHNSSPRVTNCTFSGNSASDGGGMWNGGPVSDSYGSSPKVTNCTFSGNTAASLGGGMVNCYYSSPDVTNCTFSGNSASAGGGMYNYYHCNPTLANCILWGDGPDEIVDDTFCLTSVEYSDVQGAGEDPDNGNIDADPLFVDFAGGDLRLSPDSPCVDAGSNGAVTWYGRYDLDGEPRVQDGDVDNILTVDMGAYESRPTAAGWGMSEVLNVTQGRIYDSIQDAIDDANDGDELEAMPGTHLGGIDFKGKAIRLYSRDGAKATSIYGPSPGMFHVVQCVSGEGTGTVLEGFTITGGNANGPDPNDQRGGGVYCEGSSPTVVNCVITGNSADSEGGGMYNNASSPTVTNCTLTGNNAVNTGGGICNENSSPTVSNCIIWGNTAGTDPQISGGSPIVTSSDVDGGYAGEGNIDADPCFADPIAKDFSLLSMSPCIDTGSNDAPGLPLTDDVGHPRIIDGDCDGAEVVDMGAHEFNYAYMGDLDYSCSVDFGDLCVIGPAWLAMEGNVDYDAFCNIGDSQDWRTNWIDWSDLTVIAENWLMSW